MPRARGAMAKLKAELLQTLQEHGELMVQEEEALLERHERTMQNAFKFQDEWEADERARMSMDADAEDEDDVLEMAGAALVSMSPVPSSKGKRTPKKQRDSWSDSKLGPPSEAFGSPTPSPARARARRARLRPRRRQAPGRPCLCRGTSALSA